MASGFTCAELPDQVGRVFRSAPVQIGQGRVDLFAQATDDHQWIHQDSDETRAESPFGGPIAHGFLTLSLLGSEVHKAGAVPVDASSALNYGLNRVRFLAPVPAGAALEGAFRLSAVEERGAGRMLVTYDCTLTEAGAEKPALVAEFLVLVLR